MLVESSVNNLHFWLSKIGLTSSVALPMNFPLFHHVIVAGGLEPELRHSKKAGLDTEKGSGGDEMVTIWGNTGKKRRGIKNEAIIHHELFLKST